MSGKILAFLAALNWAFAALFYKRGQEYMGTFDAFSLRTLLPTVLLTVYVVATERWQELMAIQLAPLMFR